MILGLGSGCSQCSLACRLEVGRYTFPSMDRAENLTANEQCRDEEEVSHVHLDKWPDVITLPVGGQSCPWHCTKSNT